MTHAELAARLLRDAATLFRTVGGRDTDASERVDRFATLYDRVAELVERDPVGEVAASDENAAP
jgi:hypothetical protein